MTIAQDLRSRGIDEVQAAELRARLLTFEDWNDAEMDIYDDYDSARLELQMDTDRETTTR
jgi:hypothetical protein